MKKIFDLLPRALVWLAMTAFFGAAVMFLWNALLPEIFGLPEINYWQAAGLLVLVRILSGGTDGGAHMAFEHRNPFRDRWGGLSREEREAFIRRHGIRPHHHHGMDGET